jgi:hypothetical protein
MSLLISTILAAAVAASVALDHVILAVRDLDAAAQRCEQLGFTLKPGRPHANGLLNHHVKFADGTSLELMTVQGRPRDRMARDYASLIRERDRGAYVAIRAEDLAAVARAAKQAGLSARESSSGAWRFLSFPPESDAGAVFFVSAGPPVHDPDSLTTHRNGATRLAEVTVEGGPKLDSLFAALGARPGSEARTARGPAQSWDLGRGLVTVLPHSGRERRAPVLVVLEREGGINPVTTPRLPGGVWLNFTGRTAEGR